LHSPYNFLITEIILHICYINIIGAIYIAPVIAQIYAIYLYSRSLLLLSDSIPVLKTPAGLGIFAYIFMIIDYFVGIFLIMSLFYLSYFNTLLIANSIDIIYSLISIALFISTLLLLIGMYRIGNIFVNSSIKLAAIFTFIPVLDLTAPFLFYFGSRSLIMDSNNKHLENQ
jgi:hypothetical protein